MLLGLFLYDGVMAQASSKEIAHVTRVGSKTKMDNGDIVHKGRTPESPDHLITVVTRNNKVMRSSVELKPMKEITAQKKKQDADAKAKADLSAARRKAQLEKKRARTPKPNKPKK